MNKLWTGLAATFIYNTAIAALLTLLVPAGSFAENFIFSQCIGFSIAVINSLTLARMQPGWKRWAALCVTLPASIAVGLQLSYWVSGCGGSLLHPKSLSALLIVVYIGVFFGLLASFTFVLFERIERLDMEVKQRQLDQMESEKRELEAQLKLLQAQIEPHFLFNTLANVGSLIDTDPAQARKLLERLNDWLRTALARARSTQVTLGGELEMLDNYLNILKIRFGGRLDWRIEADAAARAVPFPPMLLQPLVENAVRHGIEPKLGGGQIVIRADCAHGALRVSVRDSGAGLQTQSGAGAGLSNVRARLAALFGESGRLALQANAEGGATATLQIPLDNGAR
ncbi:MAG: histidine kinase [Gallionella sp.]|nr:histidine kinase [Gallionella sp.]MDD4947764.1 histidine kinase [Gallionella sp.]MDD5613295.1 histidine kinase [Gallionella sp.]